MELVAVDAALRGSKNGLVTKEELRKIGPKLRGMRTERGLKQIQVAEDPKAQGLSVGTLQAIEGAWYEVRDSNVDKYARFFGTTRERLLKGDKPKPVATTDPLWEDLHEEHLEIARRYMRERKHVRTAVEWLLSETPYKPQLAALLGKLETLGPDQFRELEAWFATPLAIRDLLERIRQRCLADPSYLELAIRNEALEQQATAVRGRALETSSKKPAAKRPV